MIKHFIATGHLEGKVQEEEPNIELCPHIEYCTIRKIRRVNNEYADCFIQSARKCQTYKYYERYKGGNRLGI